MSDKVTIPHDRRSEPRLQLRSTTAVVKLNGLASGTLSQILDISYSGSCFFTTLSVIEGNLISFDLSLEGLSPITVHGIVIWTKFIAKGTVAGIKFIGMPTDALNIVKMYINIQLENSV